MLVLVTYDVNVESQDGKKRLRKVAKICQNFGIRVQNSVFECVVDSVKLQELKNRISSVIDIKRDSIRYYNLGNGGRHRVSHVGAKPALDVEDVLIV